MKKGNQKIIFTLLFSVSLLVLSALITWKYDLLSDLTTKAYLIAQQYPVAEGLLVHKIKKDPQDFESFYNLGNTQYHQKKYKEAKRSYLAALNSPESSLRAKTYFNLGHAEFCLKAFAKAKLGFEYALQEREDYKNAEMNKGFVQNILNLESLGDQEKLKEILKGSCAEMSENEEQNQSQQDNQDQKQDEKSQQQENQDKQDQKDDNQDNQKENQSPDKNDQNQNENQNQDQQQDENQENDESQDQKQNKEQESPENNDQNEPENEKENQEQQSSAQSSSNDSGENQKELEVNQWLESVEDDPKSALKYLIQKKSVEKNRRFDKNW